MTRNNNINLIKHERQGLTLLVLNIENIKQIQNQTKQKTCCKATH